MYRIQSAVVFIVVLLLAGYSTNTNAELVSVDEDFVVVGNYNGSVVDFIFRIDSNAATGNFAACIGTEVTPVAEGTRYNIDCYVYDSDGNRISNVLLSSLSSLSTTGISYSIDLQNLDVGITDDDDLYILWSGDDDDDNSTAFVQAFDSSEEAIFDPISTISSTTTVVEFFNFGQNRLSLAVTPASFWVVGTSIDDTFTFEADYDVIGQYYDLAGVEQGSITFFSTTTDFGILTECISSDVASNASGDLIITWVEPVDQGTTSACAGSIYAQTYRESGTVISDATQLSDEVEDDDGDDASNFYSPVATAYEDGEYVVAWTDGTSIYSANLLLDGDVADSQETLISGDNPRIGGNSATDDYVVIGELTSGSDCVIEARLAFDADTDPETIFSPADCNQGSDITFADDGNMLLLQAGDLENNFGFLYVSKIGLPAEIEVSAVSVQEGDPQRGIANVAVIDVALTRAHPNGDDIEVSYFTRDSTALVGIDYERAEGTLTFSGSDTNLNQTISVPIIPDTDFEDDEIFEMNLENAINAVLKNEGDEADITILDDDTTPDITADCDNDDASNCRSVDEPGISGTSTDLLITLTMAEAIDSDITVNFSTSDGTATAGEDYLQTSGVLQYLAGSTQAVISVTILGDDVNEDTETFDIDLSASDSVSLPDTTLTISIINENLCSLSLEPVPNEVVVLSDGGTETFDVVSSLTTCDWDITTDVDWITITDPSDGTGTGSSTVTFDVDPFDPDPSDDQSRNGNITVTLDDPLVTQDPLVFEVGQDGDCDFTLDMSSADFDVEGGTGSFAVMTSDQTCEWSGTSDVDWVTVTSPTEPFEGDGTLEYTITDNAGDTNVENASRSFTIISEEFDFTINQDGCTFDLDPDSVDVTADSTTTSVDVLAPTSAAGSCSWTAVSNSSWILISSGSSGSGGGTVSLAILDNASVDSRTGSVTIGDETLTVNQSGQDCDYSVDPESFSVCPDGQTFDIDVTATDGCSWSLVAQDDWIEVLTNSTGIGSETASGVVLENLSETARSSSVELQASTRGTTQATISFDQDGFLVYEPFESGLPADWLFDPVADWSVVNNLLSGQLLASGAIGTALDMTVACTECKVESTVTVTTASNGSLDVLTLVGWYQNENNYAGLAMDEFTNTWRLMQIVDGQVSMVEANVGQIVPNISYDVAISFDGDNFTAELNGSDILQLAADPTVDPIGFAGFMLDSNNGEFTELRLTGESAVFEDLFVDSFEVPEVTEVSSCIL